MRIIPGNKKLLYFAGYARSRLARELERSLQTQKAYKEVNEAIQHLERALPISITYDARERSLNASIYRAIILTYEMLGDTKKLDYYFRDWFAEHRDDPNTLTEWERLSRRYSLSFYPPD